MYNVPGELSYTKAHVWVERLGDERYRVGITDFAQNELGDVVFFEASEVGREYSQSDECAILESVKSTSDIYCPLSGTIVENNPVLENSPETINIDPYGDGWLFIMQSIDDAELDELLDADAYLELTEED